MDVLIKNGNIIDGTNSTRYKKNILIHNNKIEKIGEFDLNSNIKTIDATNKIVCPGFIDTHSHSDLEAIIKPDLKAKIMQGITTEIIGQDGISMAPLPQKFISMWRKNLAGLDGDTDDIDWNYNTVENYLNMIKQAKPSTNIAYLLPHGNIRMQTVGLDNIEATQENLISMQEIINEELHKTSLGFSTGLIYMPCAYSNNTELEKICESIAKNNARFVIHQKSEADEIIESMKEIIDIGEKTGVKIHFSHFKICGKKNWDKIDAVLNLLDKAKLKGIDISFDQYPYVAGSTMLGVILPPWVHDGGTNKMIERLGEKNIRSKIIKDIENGIKGWDNFIEFAGFDGIYITSVKTSANKEAIGLNLKQFADLKHKNNYDAVFDLLIEEENAVGMIDYYGSEEHIKTFMKRPEMNVCTDGLLGGKPHPRVYGTFPRILGKYVREEQTLSLEEAIYKMTKKPADTFNIKDRGQIKEGLFADICIFDPDKVIDKSTFLEPIQYPEGIEHVFVNGKHIVENSKLVGYNSGHVLN